MNTPRLRCFLSFFVALVVFFPSGVRAQAVGSGTIVGRVFIPSTHEYARNAEVRAQNAASAITDSNGFFRLVGVPAGDVTLTVDFAGYQSATSVVFVAPGQTVEHNVDLTSALASPATDKEVVKLAEYTVSAEREGNAKAIMDQRAAMNIKNVVASDVFGDVAEGNIGEFLKYLPGINLEYAEADTRTVHLRGLAPKYTAVSFDGSRMASAGSSNLGTGRAFEFEQVSINSVDAIEVNKTVSADMDGDAVAGTINLKSKSAFSRKGRYIGWQLNAVANSFQFTTARTTGPGDSRHRKVLPGGMLEFSDTFLDGKLGVAATISESNMFNEQYRVQNTYDNVPTAANPTPVVPVTIRIKDGPKFTERTAGSLNFDYRLSSETTLSLRSQYNYYDAEFHNRQILFNASRATLSTASTPTSMIATGASGNTVRVVLGGNSQEKYGNTGSISPAISYNHENLSVDANLAFSQAINHYDDLAKGFFYNYDAWLYPITYRLDRSSTDSKSWDFTQLSGRDMYSLAGYQPSAQTNSVSSQPRSSRDRQYSGKIDAKWSASWHWPTFFKVGLKDRAEDYRLANYNFSWTYVGPNNDRTQAVVPISPIVMDPHKGGNIFDRLIQFPDRTALATLFGEHPEYFVPNPTNTTSDTNRLAKRSVREQIDAGYVMGNTRIGPLTLQGGARYERTRDGSQTYERGLPKYRAGKYDDVLLSGSAKYRFAKNVFAIASFNQGILRPDFGNLTGVATINDTNQTGTIPNPELKPEHSNNYSTRLEYYFSSVGYIAAGVFRNDISDVQFQTPGIPAEELGLGQEYPGYTFTSWRNASRLSMKGVELEYSQQLSFLPGIFKGLGVFASYTHTRASDFILAGKRAPTVVSAGFNFQYRGADFSLKGVWTDDTYDSSVASTTEVANRFQRARLMIDLNASLPIARHTRVFVSGRNIFNEPAILYENTRSLLYQHDQFGVTWTFGVKGTF